MKQLLKMKILEVNVDDNGKNGVYSLVKNFILNLDNRDIIDIAAYEHFENKEEIDILKKKGTTVYYIGYEGNKIKKLFLCYTKLKKVIKRGKYDCIHIHFGIVNKSIILGLAAKMAGAKRIILHAHASGIDSKYKWLKLVIHKLFRPAMKYIGTDFVACSNIAAKWMFPFLSNKNIVMIKNGVNLNKFKFCECKRNEIRKKYKLDQHFVIGHVGRFSYQKNHEFLLNIFSEVIKMDSSAKLLLIGEGTLKTHIEQLSKNMGIIKNVIFYGTSNNINDLMQAMDIFVLPSHFEGLPIVGVEAQAMGLPIVFADTISDELKITNNTISLSLNDNPIIWANYILKLKNKREDNTKILIENGWNIESTVQSFKNLYHKNDLHSNA